jgi:sec-independent protein translocase protein TatA
MFGSLGVPELILIFAVVLLVFGPRKIPEVGRMIGKALAEFRKATDDLKNTIDREVRLEELKQITPSIMTPLESISRSEPFGSPTPAPEPAPPEEPVTAEAATTSALPAEVETETPAEEMHGR